MGPSKTQQQLRATPCPTSNTRTTSNTNSNSLSLNLTHPNPASFPSPRTNSLSQRFSQELSRHFLEFIR